MTANDSAQGGSGPAPGMTGLATIGLDGAGRVRQWGYGARRLFGHSSEEALGRDSRRFLLGPEGPDVVDQAFGEVTAGRLWLGKLTVECADGRLREVAARWEPAVDTSTPTTVLVTVAPSARAEQGETPASDALALLGEASVRIGSTLDLWRTAREVVEVAVPSFADAAGIFVLESLLAHEESLDHHAGGAVEVRRLAVRAADTTSAAMVRFPSEEVVVHAPESSYARCVTTAKPIPFGARGEGRLGSPDGDATAGRSHDASILVTPLKAREMVLGYAVFSRAPGADLFPEDDVALASDLAAQAARCLDNARLYERERRTARALQRSISPGEPKAPPGMEIARRYRPASDVNIVGGDWYDVIELPQGRVALVVGDAMGHDTAAAAVMGHLRTSVRALSGLDLPPTEVLHQLDRMADELDDAQFATCVYAVCDPATRMCTIACAGHIPPVLAHSDGRTEKLELSSGLPLGLGLADFQSVEVQLPPESTLVFCTDGLVESRSRGFDEGIERLRATLARPARPLQETCDTILQALRHERDEDDITLLLARLTS